MPSNGSGMLSCMAMRRTSSPHMHGVLAKFVESGL
eukprot:CAMPEP_0179308086 /NCGR_PEP_ID=MMETSP0797-20121207/50968_1 /TAXON_ID=47934 /ORGANISM="Dinophysis acuminata, Strain DAEP01" /LENGTH=34 /DNA_ID= /DNA_START= /DNA_END= /DNA_ORIENTATION=